MAVAAGLDGVAVADMVAMVAEALVVVEMA